MTIDEIDGKLPNGFHDAEILRIEVDYESCQARLYMRIDAGNGVAGEDGGGYRTALLILRGLQFLAIDPPVADYPFAEPKPLHIDGGPGQPNTAPISLPEIPTGAFLHWFFVSNWNSFVRVSAMEAELQWTARVD